MANIKPFCAFHYNQDKFNDLSKLICPPYDVINPVQQEYYHNLDPYNMIHLILGKHIPKEDKYKRAATYFNTWIKEKILIKGEKPAIYFYNQQFCVKGETKNRLGFIALLRLEDKKNRIFPHEHTRIEPKEDRLRLIRRVKANLSPIFVLFGDQKRIITRVFERYVAQTTPIIDTSDIEKVNHKVWRLDSEQAIKMVQEQMDSENIFIADGHHRYEVSLALREKIIKRYGGLDSDSDYNYIMSYFTNIESRGLTIFPIHRLVRRIPGFNIDKLKEPIKKYFDIQEVEDKTKFFFLMEIAGKRQNTLGMYKDNKFYLLRLKNVKILDREITDRPKEYRSLDVTILNYLILKKIFKLDLENKDKIKFSQDSDELIAQVDSTKTAMAFFLNPVKIERLVSIAREGERMPSKSTYFYPKVPAGLVINKLNSDFKKR